MRTTSVMAAAALVTGLLGAGSAWADCELSCTAECKQESVVCVAEANLEITRPTVLTNLAKTIATAPFSTVSAI